MIAAAIPVKRLSEAKSRLAERLSPQERRALVVHLVGQTVAVLRACVAIDRIALVTPEGDLAAELQAEHVPDAGTLNSSLAGAARWAGDLEADGLLIVPGDLPLLQPDDIVALLAAARDRPSIALAPTRDGGTGALFLQPPGAILPAFGQSSFAEHLQAARLRGVPAYPVMRAAFALELDTPVDLDQLGDLWPALPLR